MSQQYAQYIRDNGALFREGLRRALARESLQAFVLYTMPDYRMGWIHEEICAELDAFLAAVVAGESPRLMITMPPRHGKSELATRRFPAYAFGRYPDISVISTSYAATLAEAMSRDVQRIIESDAYQNLFDFRLGRKGSGEQRRSDFFEVCGGKNSYRAAGVGGGITGMGGTILIIDDPFKDRAEADSPTIREKVWDWYTSTLYTRLAPGGGILLINTRWHMDDLSGRLIEAESSGEGDKWRKVDFPAIATHDEPHRKAGEALHPERYDLAQLGRIRAALGSRDWEALYQQHPTPDGGAIFRREWLRHWTPSDLPARWDQQVLSWDMTFKDSDDSDFVVGQVWGKKGGEFYLLDQVRKRMGFTETLDAFQALAAKWPQALTKLVEDKANGPAVIDSLKRRVSGIVPIEPDGSKTARAHAITPLFEAGNVFLPHSQVHEWAKDLETELLQFPAAAHDDQVDALTQALRRMSARAPMRFNPQNLQRRPLR